MKRHLQDEEKETKRQVYTLVSWDISAYRTTIITSDIGLSDNQIVNRLIM